MKSIIKTFPFCCFFLLLLIAQTSIAQDYPLPPKGNDVIGQVFKIKTLRRSNFDDIARYYNVGYFELQQANPTLNPDNVPSETIVTIPAQFILPKVRHGLVLNLAELRMYYFPKGKNIVETFPVGIGKIGERTPVGHYYILEKLPHPVWHVPQSVKDMYKEQGKEIPDVVPAGPSNPLGDYAMRLNIWSYLLHGTNMPDSVGKRTSAGCVHLYPEDVKYLFDQIKVKTPVTIINEMYKIGRYHNELVLEVETPLSEQQKPDKKNLTALVHFVHAYLGKDKAKVDWHAATKLAEAQEGIPTVIGRFN